MFASALPAGLQSSWQARSGAPENNFTTQLQQARNHSVQPNQRSYYHINSRIGIRVCLNSWQHRRFSQPLLLLLLLPQHD
jgi:hypothetical protein